MLLLTIISVALVLVFLFLYKYKKVMNALKAGGIDIDNVIITYNSLLARCASDVQWNEFNGIVSRVIEKSESKEVKIYLANLRDFYNERRKLRRK